ncbi:ExbD/TolR family protein [Granulicella tundricola]|uniref:Biopolymer transport protein ExbD/TolR n=1 Tax=Granulicella tundricola (strain ATCC BAA-1859 / DSM 23138 / MP5ACTX9) TaxID=1198114 RepID=E8WXM5_GRATM|nr:biopolymer transporter ExbD [Granulicella tundricola]ADW68641.1 Biopolymer transport protein ExbD/TolR [Granulicella tundricola MP5ACTX9]
MAFSARGAGGKTRTQTAMADINITPLVDVVLVLLLIFMLTAPVLQSGIEVAIPHTRATSTMTDERVVITIDKDQNVFLQDKPINVADLGTRLKVNEKDPSTKTVYVRADERVPFGAFATVMESVKSAGITNISIVTQPYEK